MSATRWPCPHGCGLTVTLHASADPGASFLRCEARACMDSWTLREYVDDVVIPGVNRATATHGVGRLAPVVTA